MKRLFQSALIAVLFLSSFTLVPRLSAQPLGNVSRAEKVDAPETNSQLEEFRHSPAVQRMGARLHLSTETTAKIFEDINSAIMIGAILWFIFRFVPGMYRKRSEKLTKEVSEARFATTQANERLAVVEERLSKLSIEIDAIRQQTEHDAIDDEKRIHESLEAEKQRILASVDQEIETAGAVARRNLKQYAASLAIDRASSEIRLTEADDRALIRSFGQHFDEQDHREERN